MKITRIECIPVIYPFKTPFVLSAQPIAGTKTVIIKIHTDEGITGIAETGDCYTWYLGESQDAVMHMVNHVFGPRIVLGEDPFNVDKIVSKMDAAVPFNNMAKAIIDFALHDIMGKKLGIPVYKLLGGLSMEKIPLDFVIGQGTTEKIVAEARKTTGLGYHGVKVKVANRTEEEDIANVKAVREALGSSAKIMIDANAGWTYYQALRTMEKMKEYDLAMVEQPLPLWDFNGLAKLRKQLGMPILADESAAELSQVMELIAKEAVDGFLIKLAKVGGYVKAKKWVAIAQAAGLPVTCGCYMASGLESAIQAHFIVSTHWMSKFEHENLGPLHHHDIYETTGVKIDKDLVKQLPRYEKGFMYVPEGPGLGVELNEEFIKTIITPDLKPTVISK